ncbi:MAG: DUF3365 domain-containing protein, partial [Desulfohalobiaceae bacterium]|nr:DUF3365 domain-containing protein [Desulfohalobiaceae bacterium]
MMFEFRPLGLQTRFIAGLVLAALVMGVLFAGILYFHLQNIVIREVSDRANAMLDQVNAVQAYVRNELRPRMFQELDSDRFVLQAMSSSYISRKIMETAAGQSDFRYRRVALNPRNPESVPEPFESALIKHFQGRPESSRWEQKVELQGHQYYVCARPVVFTENCMHCHGRAAEAPSELLDTYGSTRGFGHRPGQVAGVVSVGFPLQQTVQSIKESTVAYLIFYLVALLLFLSMVQIQFRKLVVSKLQKLGGIFQSHFPDEHTPDLFKENEDLEVDEMIQALGQVAENLSEARNQLKNYADNLEVMVEERTRELDQEVVERRSDVQLFINILHGLRTSSETRQLLDKVLKLLAQRLNAEQVVYYCTQLNQQAFCYPVGSDYPKLPDAFPEFAFENTIIVDGERTYVPVQSKDQLWGVLGLHLRSGSSSRAMVSDEILLALGEQLAVVLENIQALNSLLKQRDLLDSVFQGISDPLMLLDQGGGIILANQGARSIFQSDQQPALKKSFDEALGLDRQSSFQNLVLETIRTQQLWSKELVVSDSRSFQLSLYPLQHYGEKAGIQVVCTIRETTGEKIMAARLQRTEKLSSVGRLASGLAHEINNPLGTIQCYVSLLKSELQHGGQLDDLLVIERQTKRAQSIVQELLDFARPRHPEKRQCDVNR